MNHSYVTQPAIKDGESAHPVASDLRPTFRNIVDAFRKGDFGLVGMPSVEPLDPKTQKQVRDYIAEYGETLAELPDETWKTSVAQWVGSHWDVLVDLWTEESGPSDLVLDARVFEDPDGGYRVVVHLVYVP
jgi:hypothetical protein